MGATDGHKTYTIFQTQSKDSTSTQPTIKAGIIIESDDDRQTLWCKSSQNNIGAKLWLGDIFDNLDFYKNGNDAKQEPQGQPYT